jgi:site-specific DNA-methyltransferase (adenine-specific)
MLYNNDCLDILPIIEDNSIDMVLVDLPYKETGNNWDNKLIDSKILFDHYRRIVKDGGCIAMHATMKFAQELIRNGSDLYKYDIVWEKDNGTNFVSAKWQPIRIHEYVLIFGKGRVTYGKTQPMKYNPQFTKGEAYSQYSGRSSENWKGKPLKRTLTENDGFRYPKTIQKFTRDRGLHPTQKPVALAEFLIKSYTDPGDVVLDNCMGSGTSGVAAFNTDRNFIGIEKKKEYFDIARERILYAKQ